MATDALKAGLITREQYKESQEAENLSREMREKFVSDFDVAERLINELNQEQLKLNLALNNPGVKFNSSLSDAVEEKKKNYDRRYLKL